MKEQDEKFKNHIQFQKKPRDFGNKDINIEKNFKLKWIKYRHHATGDLLVTHQIEASNIKCQVIGIINRLK